MRRRARPAVSSQDKVNSFLGERLDQGPEGAYEALQLLRGQVQRSLKQQAFQGALDTSRQGALQLLKRGFVASGAALALQVVEVLQAAEAVNSSATAVSPGLEFEASLAALEEIDAAFKQAEIDKPLDKSAEGLARARDDATERCRVAKAAVKWTRARKQVGSYVLGEPRVHALAAEAQWRLARAVFDLEASQATSGSASAGGSEGVGDPLKHLAAAEAALRHQVLAEQPELLAGWLSGNASETKLQVFSPVGSSKQMVRRDRACACLRVVLQFCAVENLRDGNLFWAALTSSSSQGGSQGGLPEGEATKTAPLVVIPYLLKTCEYDAPDLFNELKSKMGDGALAQGSGMVGPGAVNCGALVRAIGQKFFNIAPPPDMMASLLSMFTAGDDE